MTVGAILMRAAMPQVPRCFPYGFEGDWTGDEKALISAAIDPHVPERVTPMFNNWMFKSMPDRFVGRRSTWDMGLFSARTAHELAEQVSEYYAVLVAYRERRTPPRTQQPGRAIRTGTLQAESGPRMV